ncbi:MAG: hypothetical protein MR424_11820 [Treponema sp.]|nr:hypothetical protein [Treponema sp.]
MSNMDQLEANIKTYEDNRPLNDTEMKLILGIADDMISKNTVPCTGCHYCVSKCPKQLDIPGLIRLYNEAIIAGSGDFIAPMALAAIDKDSSLNAVSDANPVRRFVRRQFIFQRN